MDWHDLAEVAGLRLDSDTRGILSLYFEGRFIPQYARNLYTFSILFRRFYMAKSNMSDGAADGLAAVVVISVVVIWAYVYLAGMPA